MSILILAATISLALAAEVEPATSGKYFYSDFYLERKSGFHELGMRNGVNNDSYFMMLSTDNTAMGVFTHQCKNSGGCTDVQHPFNVSTKRDDYQGTEDFTDINMYDNQKLTNVRYSGSWIKQDNMIMYFQQTERYLNLSLTMLAVDKSIPAFSADWDGFLGVAPVRSAADRSKTLMQQLKDQGKIDHMIMSLYVREHSGNYSSVKFGSYDKKGIADGASMAIYRTRENVRWSLTSSQFAVNDHTPLRQTRELVFEFGLPYAYLPQEEFTEFTERMSIWDLNLRCDLNSCKYNQKCSDVQQNNYFKIAFRISDSTGTGNIYQLPVTKLFFLDGNVLGGSADSCYIPVFRSQLNDNRWYFGNFFTSYFYLVFDQTPIEEFGKDYIQIGIAPRSSVPLVGEVSADNTATPEDPVKPVKPDDPKPIVPDPPKPVDPIKPDDPQPKPDNTSTNTTKPDVPVTPSDEPIKPIIIPDNDDKRTWMQKNGTWLIIVIIIVFLILVAIAYSCWKRRQDPYYAQHYSQVEEGPVDVNNLKGTDSETTPAYKNKEEDPINN